MLPLGFAVGVLGTLIGAGGGFVLVPVLLLVFPGTPADVITGVSLAVVFANAASGSASYARMRRIDYRSGMMFAAATIPGAVIGAAVTSFVPRRAFDALFGVLLVIGAAYLAIRPVRATRGVHGANRGLSRRLVDASGAAHEWSYPPALGIGISVAVGFASSLLGIGGGIIHVPVLAHLLDFPVHIATATSHFTLAISALAGMATHLANGTLAGRSLSVTLLLAIGVLPGAMLGARLSQRIHGAWIMRGLAAALGLVGVRVLLGAL